MMNQFYRKKKVGLFLSEKNPHESNHVSRPYFKTCFVKYFCSEWFFFPVRKPFGLLDSTFRTATGKQTADGKLK